MKPQRFGRYELLEQMGRGGMATILLARLVGPSDFQKHLVIKRIHDHLTTDDETINRFLDEARLAARIHHPNVVQLFEFDQHNGTYFIAMEYVHGENLADLYNIVRTDVSAGYHWGHAARVIAEAAAGLHAAHELVGGDGQSLRIVHRDVSPQNIMITYDGHVKVADFGIAQAVGRHHNTVDGTVMGKVAYMSPEQCRGEQLDRRTDVFALGIVLYEMVCLRRLFRAQSDQETMRRVLYCDFVPPRQARPELPAGLEQILLKALAAKPEDRYQTAAELQYAIDGLLAAERAMITASSLSALMSVVFQKEKLQKDRRIQKIYSQTFMEPPKPKSQPQPGAGSASPVQPSGPGRVTHGDEWGEAASATVRDSAPPPMAAPERRERTMRGFSTPGDQPVQTLDQWQDEAPTTVDVGERIGQSPVRAPTYLDPSEPLVWPPNSEGESGPTKPVEPGPARRVKNLGPTVELGPSQQPPASVSEPRGAVAVAHTPRSSGAGPLPATPAHQPANRLSGQIDALAESGSGSGSGSRSNRSDTAKGHSTQSLIVAMGKRSTLKMVLVGAGIAVVLGIFIGVTLTYVGNRGRSKGEGAAKSSAAKKDIVTLEFSATPPNAKLLLDGRELKSTDDSGKFVVRVPWQETPLLLKASAAGYATKTISVMPEKSQSVKVVLVRQAVSTQRLAPMAAMAPRRRSPRRAPPRRSRQMDKGSRGSGMDLKDPFSATIPPPEPRARPRSMRSGGGAAADDI